MNNDGQLWKARASVGAPQIMKTPEALQAACIEYFKWIEDNPLTSEKVGFSQGDACRALIEHPRAMTVKGLSIFIGITSKTWYEWRKKRDDLKHVIDWAEEIIFEQKLSAAAAGLLNANIISRELGLADKREIDAVIPQMIIRPPEGERPPTPPIFGETSADDDNQ